MKPRISFLNMGFVLWMAILLSCGNKTNSSNSSSEANHFGKRSKDSFAQVTSNFKSPDMIYAGLLGTVTIMSE